MDISKKVLICGFMGSGKSSILREVGDSVSARRVDLDDYIFDRHGLKSDSYLGELIDRVGMNAFRDMESRALEELLKDPNISIIALGGGTLSISKNQSNIKNSNVELIYIDTPFEICWKRIEHTSEKRPLVKLGKAKLEKLFSERELIYNDFCTIKLNYKLALERILKELS